MWAQLAQIRRAIQIEFPSNSFPGVHRPPALSDRDTKGGHIVHVLFLPVAFFALLLLLGHASHHRLKTTGKRDKILMLGDILSKCQVLSTKYHIISMVFYG
jgi:hypothetical protein